MKLCEPVLEPQSKQLIEVDIYYGTVASIVDSEQSVETMLQLIGQNDSIMMVKRRDNSKFLSNLSILMSCLVWLISDNVDKTKMSVLLLYLHNLSLHEHITIIKMFNWIRKLLTHKFMESISICFFFPTASNQLGFIFFRLCF